MTSETDMKELGDWDVGPWSLKYIAVIDVNDRSDEVRFCDTFSQPNPTEPVEDELMRVALLHSLEQIDGVPIFNRLE